MKDLLEKYHLPKKVEVEVRKVKEGGFMVEFPGLPGCYSQVEDMSQLDETVTDAILTYFDVPRSKANKVVYVPETKISSLHRASRSHDSTQTKFDLYFAA